MSRAHMLLVEDDAALAELVTWHFRKEDFDVAHTVDGEEALILAQPGDVVAISMTTGDTVRKGRHCARCASACATPSRIAFCACSGDRLMPLAWPVARLVCTKTAWGKSTAFSSRSTSSPASMTTGAP